ncbi:MAG: aminomethyl-transferring glycine dehydrogenase [Actinomycetota bacterium]
MPSSLTSLFESDEFVRRHVGPSADDVAEMLRVVDADSLGVLLDETVPDSIRLRDALSADVVGEATPEHVAIERMRVMAERNRCVASMIGLGYHGTITPPVIQRNVLENPAWYTAYTPYQPEISQGRLEAILNFQTMVTELTGLDVANASLLDEGTAVAEAVTMARRQSKAKTQRCFVDADLHPQTLAVLHTRAEPIDVDLVVADVASLPEVLEDGGVFGAVFGSPTSTGAVVDRTDEIAAVHVAGGAAIVVTDPLACVVTTPPGRMGADIAVGSAQRFGVPMGFGGPHAAFVAAREKAARSMPGRIVGVSTDTAGRPALRLALQTREQHIRREKATSNICTAQVLLANIAGFYAAWHGRSGLERIAERVHRLTSVAAAGLRDAGRSLRHGTWFDTLTVEVEDADVAVGAALDAGINIRRVDDGAVGLTFDETHTVDDVAAVLDALGAALPADLDDRSVAPDGIPAGLRRTDEFLTQSVFERYHTEHEMLRYLRRLADKDLALDRTMIPLGSCTMKLNATSEMLPITWPEFASLHPYAPLDQAAGYLELIEDLERRLAEITGYAAVSLQPNAGSQGEFAGLLAIRGYHRANGDDRRTVCLIPESAHGTNAASAVMAGMAVKAVACDDDGNVDLDDVRAKIEEVGDELSAIMITYPSTHGVFEASVSELCGLIHDAGGQVYVDGANLNALVGLAKPGRFGADVSHLNLHKTFCIPHGGGGPGVGPIGVGAHLAPFLPGSVLTPDAPVGPVAAAPYGSAGILPIPWMYLEMMGGDGLTRATEVAILGANYVATRLDEHFPVLYRGDRGRVGHECIIDLRPITKATGVSVDDVAKRLMDYSFHAPTMSFPVAGTLMIEPTESETLRELDRFCEAMIAIRGEIERVASGEWSVGESPLHHAPHTAEDLVADWSRPYDRELGAFPVASLRATKYFPPVSRIDGAYGDRNLVCSCEPLEALAT